jgi:GT2 family glycosyltransferase
MTGFGPSGTQRHEQAATVTVVVVTFNNAELVDPCLDAIDCAVTRWPHEVVVVDNASSDGTVARVRSHNRTVRCVVLGENRGFAVASNVGIRASDSRYVALVNSDTFVDAGSIDKLVDFLEVHTCVGIVGGRLRYPSGASQPSAGRFPSLLGNLWMACCLHRLPGSSRLALGVHTHPALYRRARRVDWVTGAFCVARREVGFLPEEAFMYGEDVEWASVARSAGYATWVEPAATAVHIGNATVQRARASGFKQARRVEFELRWFHSRGSAYVLTLRAIWVMHACTRILLYGLLYPVHRRAARNGIREFRELLRYAVRPA